MFDNKQMHIQLIPAHSMYILHCLNEILIKTNTNYLFTFRKINPCMDHQMVFVMD